MSYGLHTRGLGCIVPVGAHGDRDADREEGSQGSEGARNALGGLFGYAQAVKVGDTNGRILDHSNREAQMRQTYENAKKILAAFGASLDDVLEEVIYVTDMDKAFAVAGPVRKEAYGQARPAVASTITALAHGGDPEQPPNR